MEGKRIKKLEDKLEDLRNRYEYACNDVKDFSKRIRYLEEQRIEIWGRSLTTVIYLTIIVFLWLISISLILKYKKIICE